MRVLRNPSVFHAIGRWHRASVLLALASLLSRGYNLPWFSTKEMFIALSVYSTILIFDFITTPWTQSLFGIDTMPDFLTYLPIALMKKIGALCTVCLPFWIAMYSTLLLCSAIAISSRLSNRVFDMCAQLSQDCRINWILDGTNFAVLYRPEVHLLSVISPNLMLLAIYVAVFSRLAWVARMIDDSPAVLFNKWIFRSISLFSYRVGNRVILIVYN